MVSTPMNDPLLLRQLIPPVTARTAEGAIVRAWDYKQKRNLVIVFPHADCAHCHGWLEQLAARAADLTERKTVVLVIYAEGPARAAEILTPPVIVAADVTGHSQRGFLGPEAFGSAGLDRVGAFVTDRYGELYGQWIGRDAAELPPPGEILGMLSVIEMIC